MRHYALFLALFALAVFPACTKRMEGDIQQQSEEQSVITKASEQEQGYIFNASANVWMMRQDDPYAIDKIRAFADDSTITPTHFALKIYPRNEQELNEIIRIPDIVVSYIPFGYQYVDEDTANKLDKTVNNTEDIYYEEERYFIDYGELGKQPLPALYVTWSVNKPLPAKYDYIKVYETCLPNSADSGVGSRECMIAKAITGSRDRTINGFVVDYDDLLGKYVSVRNLRIRVSYGQSTLEAYTNDGGYFSITGNINDAATVSIVYENEQWRLTNSSLFTYVVSLGTVGDRWGASGAQTSIRTNTEAQVLHRAANHFYNGGHDISTPASSYSLRINMETTGSTWSGVFESFPLLSPYVRIKLASYYYDYDYAAHILHELGHFNNYQVNGGYSNYYDVISLIKESYADYIAWYLVRDYYTVANQGVFNNSWEYYLLSGNQYWEKTDTSPYSPLFVDLYDDFNQRTSGTNYNNDLISGVPHSLMPSIVSGNKTWPQLRTTLYWYIGVYFTYDEYTEFAAPYDWYTGLIE